jgi:hypothetical protein
MQQNIPVDFSDPAGFSGMKILIRSIYGLSK